jgi:hypothetical protein
MIVLFNAVFVGLATSEAAHDTRTTQEPQAADETDAGQDGCGVQKNGEESLGTDRGGIV